ncbi:MAG: DUF6807 family protein [Acidobacteriota bacterium]
MTRLLPVLLAACAAALAQGTFAFRETAAGAIELSERGKPVYVYNFGPVLGEGFPENMRRCCYLHPVYAPDGTLLTDDFNKDHPHHRGISWMWPVVVFEGRTYDMWTLVGGLENRFVRWRARETRPEAAVLRIENGWFLGERRVMREDVEIVAHAAEAGRRNLEFTLRLTPTGAPVEIAGTSEGNKGFGGFSFRFAPRDGGAAKTVIRTEQGVSEKDGVLAVHPWAEVEGSFAGKRESGRVYDDPANPGFPNGWLMRHGFGFLNVSYPGLKPVRIERRRPLTLKYRVTLASEPSLP